MQRRNKVIAAGICAVAVVVGTLGSKLEQGTAKYPLRMRPVAIEKLTGYFEGCRTKAYKDTGGISTVGIGSTEAICGKIDLNRTYTVEEIADRLNKDLYYTEQCVNKHFSGWNLPQTKFEAVADFVFNVGCGKATKNKNGRLTQINRAFLQATLTGDYTQACERFLDWRYAKNTKGQMVVLKGLDRRRQAEKEWCLQDD